MNGKLWIRKTINFGKAETKKKSLQKQLFYQYVNSHEQHKPTKSCFEFIVSYFFGEENSDKNSDDGKYSEDHQQIPINGLVALDITDKTQQRFGCDNK